MARWHSWLVSVAAPFVAQVAKAEESVPDMLRRVAPSIVRIKSDDDVAGSGFVYPTSRHVVTSYTAVNHDGELLVEVGPNARIPARVVAWSEKHDVAILELAKALEVTPLQLEPNAGFAGQQVVLLGRPAPVVAEGAEKPIDRELPTPRFGFVGLVSPGTLNVDVGSVAGDEGAPLLTTSGRVLGVVSGRTDRRLGLLDAASGSRIVTVQQHLGAPGKFEPHPRAPQGAFGGVYASPWQAYHLVGAGILTGYRYRWLSATLAVTFSHASFTPLDASRMRARWAMAYELYGTADWSYTKHRKLIFGAGLALTGTAFEVRDQGRKVDLPAEEQSDGRADPLLVIQDVEGPFLFGVTWAPVAQAARLDIGVVVGR